MVRLTNEEILMKLTQLDRQVHEQLPVSVLVLKRLKIIYRNAPMYLVHCKKV